MAVSREEFAAWRSSECWQELMILVNTTVEQAVSEIINRDKSNTDRDQYLRGLIYALSEVAGFTPEIVEDSDEA